MKKVVVLISTMILFAGLTFAQTPQTQDKSKPAPKTENAQTKDPKAGCDKKDMKNCTHGKDAKGCCAHDKEGKKPANPTPEKK